MCCYRSRLVFSCCFVDRATNSCVQHLTLTTPLPVRDTVLKNYTNKARLNALICEQVLSDNDFMRNSTQNHKLVVTEDKSEPKQVSEGQKHPVWIFRQCMKRPTSSLQQAIHFAKEDPKSTVSVVSDDTDVFALLLYFYRREMLQSTMTMQSPMVAVALI